MPSRAKVLNREKGEGAKPGGKPPAPGSGSVLLDEEAVTKQVTAAELPTVGVKFEELGDTLKKVDLGTAQNIVGNNVAKTAFNNLVQNGKITNAKGIKGWKDLIARGTSITDGELSIILERGYTIRGSGEVIPAADMEQAMREFQWAIAKGEPEVRALLSDEDAFINCFTRTLGRKRISSYTSDVAAVPTADAFQQFTAQHLGVLNKTNKLPKGLSAAEAPGAPKFKIRIGPDGGPLYGIEIEWQTFSNYNNLQQLARDNGYAIPQPLNATLIPNVPPQTPGTWSRDILSAQRGKDLLHWLKGRTGMDLSRSDIASIRLRGTADEFFRGGVGSSLQGHPHLHYEVVLKDGTQMNYAVEFTNVTESRFGQIFTGKSQNWNFFEDFSTKNQSALMKWLFGE